MSILMPSSGFLGCTSGLGSWKGNAVTPNPKRWMLSVDCWNADSRGRKCEPSEASWKGELESLSWTCVEDSRDEVNTLRRFVSLSTVRSEVSGLKQHFCGGRKPTFGSYLGDLFVECLAQAIIRSRRYLRRRRCSNRDHVQF